MRADIHDGWEHKHRTAGPELWHRKKLMVNVRVGSWLCKNSYICEMWKCNSPARQRTSRVRYDLALCNCSENVSTCGASAEVFTRQRSESRHRFVRGQAYFKNNHLGTAICGVCSPPFAE